MTAVVTATARPPAPRASCRTRQAERASAPDGRAQQPLRSLRIRRFGDRIPTGAPATSGAVRDRPAGPETFDEILTDSPSLERDDLFAALEYGAATTGCQQVMIAGEPAVVVMAVDDLESLEERPPPSSKTGRPWPTSRRPSMPATPWG
jgi:hypothetical protein